MKLSLLVLAALAVVASAEFTQFRKQADATFLEKQRNVLKTLVGLGADPADHDHVDFPYNKPELYKKPHALESFMRVYKRGLLDKHGYFSLYCNKVKYETFKIYELFYFAKDFNTFHDIATWARDELHPLEFGFTYILAVLHREDTRGIYVPPLYEIVPQFFIQTEAMHKATTEKDNGKMYAKVEVNGTGWEYSWHNGRISGPYSPRRIGVDPESRMSYFREDVGLANFLAFFSFHFSTWFTKEMYPDIHFSRRGEVYYSMFKYLKNRYNLERMANGLPPVVPFSTFEPLPGYNPHLQDNFGRNFLARSNGMVSEEVNKAGTWQLINIMSRISDVVDSGIAVQMGKELKFMKLHDEGVNSLDEFAKIIYGTSDAYGRTYYKNLYYAYTTTINEMVKSANDREFTSTAMGEILTQPRDPAFYMVLASLDNWFEKFLHKQKPYKTDELSFPGVSIEKFELDRLDTYFERYDWELTNGLDFPHRHERREKKFEASQFRLNHKPYSYKVHVKSDQETDVVVRVFLGPKYDVDGRAYTMDQQRQGMILFDIFHLKAKSGENVFERHSHQNPYFETYQRYRPFYEKVNKSLESNEPFYYTEFGQCGMPSNLMVPRGWESGKEYAIFTIITKYDYTPDKEGYYPCAHNFMFDQHSLLFPSDRPIYNEQLLPNMYYTSVKIYHDSHSVFKHQ